MLENAYYFTAVAAEIQPTKKKKEEESAGSLSCSRVSKDTSSLDKTLLDGFVDFLTIGTLVLLGDGGVSEAAC